jgi:hypothetical protein
MPIQLHSLPKYFIFTFAKILTHSPAQNLQNNKKCTRYTLCAHSTCTKFSNHFHDVQESESLEKNGKKNLVALFIVQA